MIAALAGIEAEMREQVKYFKERDLLIEAQRIEQRTMYDIEMMQEIGFCQGIENYSRHISGRAREVHRIHCLTIFLTIIL